MSTVLLHHLVESPRACSYLPGRQASLEHRIQRGTTEEELDGMLARGWRRFGPDYFRPACKGCQECVPTRLDVEQFRLSRSQRRTRNQCAGLSIEVGQPLVDAERLELYHRWHRARETHRGWGPSPLTERQYALQFAFPHPAAREIAFFDGDGAQRTLVGLGICDETPTAWSAVYFFYDPAWRSASLGRFNILTQVDVARARGRRYVYLGYRVDGCPSMSYKAAFQPQQRLVGWPSFDETPRWETRRDDAKREAPCRGS